MSFFCLSIQREEIFHERFFSNSELQIIFKLWPTIKRRMKINSLMRLLFCILAKQIRKRGKFLWIKSWFGRMLEYAGILSNPQLACLRISSAKGKSEISIWHRSFPFKNIYARLICHVAIYDVSYILKLLKSLMLNLKFN